jgi:hypothetical protein
MAHPALEIPAALDALVSLLQEPTLKDERTEQDDSLIELVLTLLRNILSAPNPAVRQAQD